MFYLVIMSIIANKRKSDHGLLSQQYAILLYLGVGGKGENRFSWLCLPPDIKPEERMRNTIISLLQHARANPTGADPDWDLGRGNQPLAAAELFNRSQWDRWGKGANRDSNTTDFCCSYQHQLDFLKWSISYLLYALKRISKEFKQLKNNYIHQLNCCAQERTHWTSYPPGVHFLKFIVRLYYDTWTVQCSSVAQLRLTVTSWTAVRQASLSITNSWNLLKLMSIESVMPSNHLILCCLLILLPSIFPNIRVYSDESALCISRPKYWSFSFNISPSNEDPGLISFRMDRLDLLAVQRILKSLLQHHGSKALIFIAQLYVITAQLYMITGKTTALTRRTFVGKVLSLLFNMLSRLVITFLPRNKHLLISWLQSPSAVILEPKK